MKVKVYVKIYKLGGGGCYWFSKEPIKRTEATKVYFAEIDHTRTTAPQLLNSLGCYRRIRSQVSL